MADFNISAELPVVRPNGLLKQARSAGVPSPSLAGFRVKPVNIPRIIEVSEFTRQQVDWWQDLGDGVLLTYYSIFTDRPNWQISINFRDAMKLGYGPGMESDVLVYEDDPNTVYLPNGHWQS